MSDEELAFWLIALAIASLIPATIASRKGKPFLVWYLYALLIWIVALVHSILLRPDEAAIEQRAIASGRHQKCPSCAELVKAEAKVCRYCGASLEAGET